MNLLSMKFPSERVQELEAELKEVRSAFEQYVNDTKEMETTVEQEFKELRTYRENEEVSAVEGIKPHFPFVLFAFYFYRLEAGKFGICQ